MSHSPRGHFAASSVLLQKRWQEDTRQKHLNKVQTMKAGLDNSEPRQYPHLKYRLKQVQLQEDRQAKIDHDNQLMLKKMSVIATKKHGLDNRNDYSHHSLNVRYRNKEQEKIAVENVEIAKRLDSIRHYYHKQDWDDDFARHEGYQAMIANTTKEYEMSPRQKKKSDTDRSTKSRTSHAWSQKTPREDFESRHSKQETESDTDDARYDTHDTYREVQVERDDEEQSPKSSRKSHNQENKSKSRSDHYKDVDSPFLQVENQNEDEESPQSNRKSENETTERPQRARGKETDSRKQAKEGKSDRNSIQKSPAHSQHSKNEINSSQKSPVHSHHSKNSSPAHRQKYELSEPLGGDQDITFEY